MGAGGPHRTITITVLPAVSALSVSDTEHRVSRATYLILEKRHSKARLQIRLIQSVPFLFPVFPLACLILPLRHCPFRTLSASDTFLSYLILEKRHSKARLQIKLIQSVPFLSPVFPLACLILPLRHCRLPTLSYPITKLPGLCEHRWQLNLLNQEATE